MSGLCDICGDTGITEVIATCSKCHKAREHIYCMKPNLCSVPKSWYCEACRYLENEGMLESLQYKDHACKVEPVDKVVCWEENGASISRTSLRFGEENLPNPPAVIPFWKGSFEILNFHQDLYDGFQAYRAQKISGSAFFASKQMPRVLQLALQPRVDVWPEAFDIYSSSGPDVAVYFWVDGFCRSTEKYNCLLELMEKQDLSMQSRLDGVNLLIFTSRQLPPEYQRINEQFYLWGIFLSLERWNSSSDLRGKDYMLTVPLLGYGIGDDTMIVANEDEDQTENMEIDMVGGNEVGVVDKCLSNNSRNARFDNLDVPVQSPLTEVHSDQPIEKSIVECYLHHTCGGQSVNMDAPGYSGPFSSDAADKKHSAVSPLEISPVAHKAVCSNKLQWRDSSPKGLAKCSQPSDSGMHIVVADPTNGGLENVEEGRDELVCMLCREGYSLRPNDMLGIYCYGTRVSLDTGTSGSSDGVWVYSTVSQFNVIHFQCHREAKRADASHKKPKKEWQGARLRNNGIVCNCLFPLKGPSVPLLQYVRCVGEYWDNLNVLGQVDRRRLKLLIYDIVLMLTRIATGTPFSTDKNGGGTDSNSRFLPFMIQMAQYLLDQEGTAQRQSMAKDVSFYLTSTPTGSEASIEKNVEFMMVNSLLSESYESWLTHRKAFLQRGIFDAYMHHMHGQFGFHMSTSSDLPLASKSRSKMKAENTSETMGVEMDENNLFSIIQPMLVYTGLIEQLQRFFKLSMSSNAMDVKTDKSDGTAGLKDWEVVMKEKLVDVKQMLRFSKKLLLWLKEMNSAMGLQEAINVMGVSCDIRSCGFSESADFVRAAIDPGKRGR